ncbi:MAG TPA: GNAT family protein [Flavisolibacter sp.]|nr:GNAT family protein [Flavisolibacter sp.]
MLSPNFTPFPVLETERLLLRQVAPSDAPEVFFLRSNKEVMKYIDRPPAATLLDALDLIQKIETALQNNEGITWAITLKSSGELIGTIGFWRIDKEAHRAEIGYLLHPAQQGKGLMKEAINKVLHYGFSQIKLHSVEANTNVDNTASQKLLESLGFVKEAHFRENYYYNGQFLDSVIYSLLTPERQIKKRLSPL